MPDYDRTTWITTRDLNETLRDLEQVAENEIDGFAAGIEYAVETCREKYDIEP